MHPQIIRDAPGNCPICGMALEPMLPTGGPSPELAEFTRRMWISAAAAIPLIVLTMGELVNLPVRDWIGHRLASYIEFALATPIVLWAAAPFFRRGWESIKNRSPNMWTPTPSEISVHMLGERFLIDSQPRRKNGAAAHRTIGVARANSI